LYVSLRILFLFMTDTHSSLFFAFCLHLFTLTYVKCFSLSLIHLCLSLLTFLLLSGLLTDIFLATHVWSILISCSNHSNLLLLAYAIILRVQYNSLSSCWVLILWHVVQLLHTSSKLSFLTYEHNLSFSVMEHDSHPYITVCFDVL
jgi:hypothetical protein